MLYKPITPPNKKMLTVCRRFHSYEAVEIVLHQDSKGFRTGFDGVLQMGNPPSKILIRGIGVYRGKKRLRVEGFRCYENCGLCQATTGISEFTLASNSGKTREMSYLCPCPNLAI
jgi:hypothetical protein